MKHVSSIHVHPSEYDRSGSALRAALISLCPPPVGEEEVRYWFYEPTFADRRLTCINRVEVSLEERLASPQLREDGRFGAN